MRSAAASSSLTAEHASYLLGRQNQAAYDVVVGDMDGNAIHGVFTSEEKAKELIASMPRPWKLYAQIEIHAVDEPVNAENRRILSHGTQAILRSSGG
jgi:hypothetical protein